MSNKTESCPKEQTLVSVGLGDEWIRSGRVQEHYGLRGFTSYVEKLSNAW